MSDNDISTILRDVQDIQVQTTNIDNNTRNLPTAVGGLSSSLQTLTSTADTINRNVNTTEVATATIVGTARNIDTTTRNIDASTREIDSSVRNITSQNQKIDGELNQILTQLSKTTASSLLQTVTGFVNYCSVRSGDFRFTTDALSAADALALPALPIGKTVSLAGLVPDAGALVPSTGTPQSLVAIPSDAVLPVSWVVEFSDDGGQTWVAAQASKSAGDRSGHLQTLSGDLSSKLLTFVPWPAPPTNTSGSALQNLVSRTFRAHLQVNPWWPGIDGTGVGTWTDVPGYLYGRIQDWGSVLGSQVDENGWALIRPDMITGRDADFPALRNLFRVQVSNPSPQPGQAATATIIPSLSSNQNPQKVDSIVNANPDNHIQASLDVGAPIEALTSSAVNAITSAFGVSSPIPHSVPDGILNVAKVLAGDLSIPVALDYNGASVTKTLKPYVDEYASSIGSQPGSSSVLGQMALGPLLSTISMTSDDIGIASYDGRLTYKRLRDSLGLSLLPIPKFESSSGPEIGDKYTITIGLHTKLMVPGSSVGIDLNYDLGTIEIEVPKIRLPNLAFFFHNYFTDSKSGRQVENQNILITADPTTSMLLPNVATIKQEITSLTRLIGQIMILFDAAKLGPPWIALNSVLNGMLVLFNDPATTFDLLGPPLPDPTGGYMDPNFANKPVLSSTTIQFFPDNWFRVDSSGGAHSNASAAIMIGVPQYSTYTLFIGLEGARTGDRSGMLAFDGRDGIGCPVAMIGDPGIDRRGLTYFPSLDVPPFPARDIAPADQNADLWNDNMACVDYVPAGRTSDWFRDVLPNPNAQL